MRGNLHKIMSMTLGESALSCSVRPMVMPKVKERFRIRLRFTMTCPRSEHQINPVSAGGILLCNFMLFINGKLLGIAWLIFYVINVQWFKGRSLRFSSPCSISKLPKTYQFSDATDSDGEIRERFLTAPKEGNMLPAEKNSSIMS